MACVYNKAVVKQLQSFLLSRSLFSRVQFVIV